MACVSRTSSSVSRYSSSIRSMDPVFEQFHVGEKREKCPPPCLQHTEGYTGVSGPNARPVHGRPASMGVVKADGDSYFLSVDVSQFEPHDIVVMAYNHRVTVHAEKVGEGGSIMDTLSHKTLLPADMDPLSTSCSLTPEGVLVISVQRLKTCTSSQSLTKRMADNQRDSGIKSPFPHFFSQQRFV
ncbi:heat shock protein beta-7 [Denticeps clupeoides]|uniref:heat shock protein beta-7 n=1 Tax=Denticeps clupeoides TaxID=299321 RepID=UPI0010A58855|nr:heat shock protein beta-7-like [Denticeps clupeoides]